MVNGAGEGNFRRIIHHPSVGRYHLVQRSLCPCRDGKEGMGEDSLAIARPGWLPTGSVDDRFLPAAGCTRSSATSWAYSSCLASSSWHQRMNWSSEARFAGLLVMVLNSDGLVGCLGIAKALLAGGSPGR